MFTYKTAYLKRQSLIIVWLLAVSLGVSTKILAQSAESKINNSSIDTSPRQTRKGTLIEQAIAGEIPLSFGYERLQVDTRKTRRLPPTSLPEQDEKSLKPQQIGVTRQLEPPLRLSADSVQYEVAGGQVFLMSVISERAKSIRVRFSQMNLPKGARIFVFPLGNKNEFYGPFKNSPLEDDTFWTPPIDGEVIVIECFIPNSIEDKAGSYFNVLEVAHSFVGSEEFLLNAPQPCHNEVGNAYVNIAKSVGHLVFVNEDGPGTCTGTLLNSASGDFTPYLLTANHCIRTQVSAQSLTVYWNYNTGDTPPFGTPTTFGAELLSTWEDNDYSLLKMY